ncbi:PREDICTED: beta-1,3-galactosyltransferase 1-like [Branchiostoma belcheri]|uniref:Hexosyltransferase n=1 Tax=Branchiostoma belcheri TaxID=7741 RepID=A0A6P4Z591_BRABE|nr:PREDICTED: beta-1,3-galactosyltransferase 1-like [Branchiostoma belcheri]
MNRGKLRVTLKLMFLVCVSAGCFHMYLLRRHLHRLERRRELKGRLTPDTKDDVRRPLTSGTTDDIRGPLTSDIADDVRGELHHVEGLAPASGVRTSGRTLHADSKSRVSEVPVARGNASESGSESDSLIVNPHPYRFVRNHPGKCAGKNVFLLVIVTSSPNNHAQRHAIRHTWGNATLRHDVNVVTVFAVGRTDDAATQRGLDYENRVQKDIIQEDFVDSYRNLTLKTVMCLKWASEFCPGAKFVMKADDDTFVNIYSLVRYLKHLPASNTTKLLMGHVFSGAQPIRDSVGKQKKWYLSKEDYSRETFPKYPCGFAYVMSGDVVRPLYEVSLTVKYLFLEDAYVGLCLEKLGIEPAHQPGFRIYKAQTNSCTSVKELASHWFKTPEDMFRAWNVLSKRC